MQPFTTHTGLVVPLDRSDVNTDDIIPKQFLKRIERTGFGEFLFFDWRYHNDGSNNPEFVLNRPEYAGASVLLARRNFGCGSSREHAPWALENYGFRVDHRPELRRHLLQQLLQERHVADQARRGGGRRSVRPRRRASRATS